MRRARRQGILSRYQFNAGVLFMSIQTGTMEGLDKLIGNMR